MRFEWDNAKAEKNRVSHGVSFEEAKRLFESGIETLEIYDYEHSEYEERFKSIGPIDRGIVLVVWTERQDDVIRIISARFATKNEQSLYEEYVSM